MRISYTHGAGLIVVVSLKNGKRLSSSNREPGTAVNRREPIAADEACSPRILKRRYWTRRTDLHGTAGCDPGFPNYAVESREARNRSVFRPELWRWSSQTAEEPYNSGESEPKKEIPAGTLFLASADRS